RALARLPAPDAETVGDGIDGGRAVAAEHEEVQALRAQLRHGFGGTGTQVVGEAEGGQGQRHVVAVAARQPEAVGIVAGVVAERQLQAHGQVVAMLGDGINDAPVLAGADVSIALGQGAPNAHRAADIVLLGDSLLRVPQTIDVARRCRRIIRQNLAWAGAYNLIALPIAALGWVTPWLAALGMAASSLIVTGNALRLSRSSASAPPRLPSTHDGTERAPA